MGWPIRDVVRRGSRDLDGPTLALGGALGLLWVVTLGAAAAPDAWMARSHRLGSPAVWALTQPLPFMYTHEHTWVVQPDDPDAEGCPRAGRRNHAPTAALTGPIHRPGLRACAPATVTLTTRWRDHSLTSRWSVRPDGDGLIVQAAP